MRATIIWGWLIQCSKLLCTGRSDSQLSPILAFSRTPGDNHLRKFDGKERGTWAKLPARVENPRLAKAVDPGAIRVKGSVMDVPGKNQIRLVTLDPLD